MKKRLWKLAIILVVLGLAGCQNATQADNPGNVITKQPEATATPVPTDIPISNVEVTKEAEATVTPAPTSTPESIATPVPMSTPIPKPMVEDATAVVISLPDDSNHVWEDEWAESETNVRVIWTDAPEQGKLRIKLCYPDSVDASKRGEEFELFINEQNVCFFVKDCIEEGTMSENWKYYTFELDYDGGGEKLEIVLKTHSSKGSKGTAFAVADLTVTEKETGEIRKIDLLSEDVSVSFQQFSFVAAEEEDYDYGIYQVDKGIMKKQKSIPRPTLEPTPSPKPTPKPTQEVEGSDWYHLTYRLPETTTGWSNVWLESEANIIFLYSSDKKLSQGTAYITLNVPKLSGANRIDTFEWAVHAQDDFMNWAGEGIEIIYDGDEVTGIDQEYEVQELTEYDGHYQVRLEVGYDSSKVKDGRELQLIFKSHSGSQVGAYEVTLSNLEICDDVAGTKLVDFSEEAVSIIGTMLLSEQQVEYILSKKVQEFYIKNSIEKMPIGETYQIEVYTSDDVELAFESSDTSVITVDTTGKITSHKGGSSTITVTNKDTGDKKGVTILVSKPQIIATECETLMISGREGQLHFMTNYATKEGAYQYASSDTSVATVDENGFVKAKKDGITTITVTDTANEVTLSYEMEVFTPEDKDGIGQYISMKKTGNVTADIAKRSYQLLYDVYKNVFDYFNYGEYEDVTLYFTVDDYSPAYSDAKDVYLASEHMLANAKDVDCITHELIHCAQNHISVGEHVWLMEGLTDYGRYLFGLHNEDCGWALPEYDASQHYTNSYTVTAAFIKFVTDNYCADMPHIINKMFKGPDGYDESIWKENTGYTIDELWELYSKS